MVAFTTALARAAGSSLLNIPEPTKTVSAPNFIIKDASAGVAIPPAAKFGTGNLPVFATSKSNSNVAPIFLASYINSSLSNREIDYELAKKVIKERMGKSVVSDLTIEEIVRRVSIITHVSEKDIVSASRKMKIAEARQVSIYLCREILGTPLVSIGMHFGGRDHSTILHACRVVEKKTKIDQRISTLVGELKNELSFAMN